MPLACRRRSPAATDCGGRWSIDAIRSDPAWKGGDYASEPVQALRTASDLLTIAGSAPQQLQKACRRATPPTPT